MMERGKEIQNGRYTEENCKGHEVGKERGKR